MLIIGVPGMVFGMMAGSVIARSLGAGLAPTALVIVDYVAMMMGMCAGMLIPHALEYALPASWRSASIELEPLADNVVTTRGGDREDR
jgi:hypothetical protein